MVRVSAAAFVFFFAISAHAFGELLDEGTTLFQSLPDSQVPDDRQQEDPVACRHTFGWGRSTVTLVNLETGVKSECKFSHTERVQIPSNSTNALDALFFQHYTCTDGTRANYSTNWLGGAFSIRHLPTGKV